MTRIYTRTGDDGTTGILGDDRVKKFDLRMETLGTIDELTAALGMAEVFCLTRTIIMRSLAFNAGYTS